MAADGDRIDELVGRCLVQACHHDGHALYLRHPHDQQVALVGYASDRAAAEQTRRKLRRILLGIVYEALQLPITVEGESEKGA